MLDGGKGHDTLLYDSSDAGVTVNLATGDTISNFENIVGSAHDDTLSGDSAANTIRGLEGDDYLVGGAGNDLLHLGSGSDVVKFGLGVGHDTIADDGFDAASTDRLDFGAGIEADDLWFRRDSDNLVVQILGTDDRVAPEGWFDAARTLSDRLDEFTASGESLTEANVQKLVDAMATWRTANDATLSDPETMPDDRTLAAALDAAWQPASG